MSTKQRPQSDDPDELTTQGDDLAPLSHAEAEVAGIVPGMIVYGDDSINPNADERRDLNDPESDEHV